MKKTDKEAIVITTAAIKGGVFKTTTTAALIWHLGRLGYKILGIDADPQGNLTECFFLETVRDLRLKEIHGIFEAIKTNDPKSYVQELTPTIDILISEDTFGIFPDWLYTEYKDKSPKQMVIKERIIDKLKADYDFIIFDTAPSLGTTLLNCFAASDYVLGLYEPSKYCFSSLLTLSEATELLKKSLSAFYKQSLEINTEFIGILPTCIDPRRSDMKTFLNVLKTHPDFKDLCFKTQIVRKASTARLAHGGFFENPEVEDAIEQYYPVTKELLNRVKKSKNTTTN